MTWTMLRAVPTTAAGVALAAASLAACATPAYPTRAGYTPPPPITPRYAIQAPAPAPATAPAPPPTIDAPTPDPADAAPSAAPVSVESQALPAIGSPPPAAAAAAPVNVPPAPPAYEPPAYSPPQTYVPPPAAYRREPPRYAASGKVVAARRMFRDYEVQKGDHLDLIARDLQTTRQVLIEANRLKAPYVLNPGQHLKVPVAKAYVAQGGDTMSEVAKRFSVGVGELADLNGLSERARLTSGEQIALPASYRDRGPIELAPARLVVAPRPSRRVYAAPYEAPATGGPYVPSQAALEAGARHRAETQAPATSGYAPPAYTPATPRYTPSYASPRTSGGPTLTDAQIAAAGAGRFVWPVKGDILSPFGVKGVGRRNDGLDIKAPQGTSVRAAASGEVVYAGDQVPGFGNLVLIKHADGWVSAYAHLDRASVQMRQTVVQGQEIGQVGMSGGATEPQLHFEIRYAPTATDKAKPVDPTLVLPK